MTKERYLKAPQAIKDDRYAIRVALVGIVCGLVLLAITFGIYLGRTIPPANTMQLTDCHKDKGDTVCTSPVELGKDEFLKVKIIPVVE